MSGHDIIVIGASAGGVEALSKVVSQLPADFPAAIFIVLHVSPHGTSALPQILSRAGSLPATHPKDGQAIEAGHIYVAPPDQHLLLKQGSITLTHGPRENGNRPAVDPLLRTAARIYGDRVIGVILSGVLDDGTAGLKAVKQRGGIAIAQDPDDALYSSMPRSAIENVDVDYVTPIADMGALLSSLVNQPADEVDHPMSDDVDFEADIAELNKETLKDRNRPGKPSAFICPECGGVLWEIDEGDLIHFRCRTGHAYSAETLMAEQSDALENAFWVAMRALEESASLSRRLEAKARKQGYASSAARFAQQAEASEQRAELMRQVLLHSARNPKTDVIELGSENAADVGSD